MIVEEQLELIGTMPERHQRPVIETRPAVHQQQRVTVADDFDEEGHIADGSVRHGGSSQFQTKVIVRV